MEKGIDRNYGIDILRFVSMAFVIILHTLGHGGVLKSILVNTNRYKIFWFIEIFAYCAVDIFALISGYIQYSKKEIKISNIINLWLEVIFYSLIISIFLKYILHIPLSKYDILKSFFPLSNKLYWYFTAYVGLFIFIPFINTALRNMTNDSSKRLLTFIIIVFSLYNVITNSFELNRGYSFIWLIILYIVGGIIKKCNILNNYSSKRIIIYILLLNTITWLWKIYGFDVNFWNFDLNPNTFITYISPTIVLISILYIELFSRIRIKNSKLQRIIFKLAPCAFAIYLINDNIYIRQYFIKNNFIYLTEANIFRVFLVLIGTGIIFIILAIIVDSIRISLFKLLRINKINNHINEIYLKEKKC